MTPKPKIALVPSGYKTGKIYSIIPNDGTGDLIYDRDIPTKGTRVNKDGLIEEMGSDLPRLDWLNNDCPNLLLEATRTNFLPYSEEFNSSTWNKRPDIVVTANQAIAPSGEFTADKLQRTSTVNTNNYINDQIVKPVASDIVMTLSVFVKQGKGDFFAMRQQGLYPQRGDAVYQFSTNTLTLTIPTTNPTNVFEIKHQKVEDYGNGWKRLTASFKTDSDANINSIFSPRHSSGFVDSFDTSNDAFVYIWGAQIEKDIGSTTYIKTANGSATRNTDNAESENSFTLGKDVVFFLDFEGCSFNSNFKSAYLCRDNSFNSQLKLISYESGGEYYFRLQITVGGTPEYAIAFGEQYLPFYQRNKFAISFTDATSYKVYVNGVNVKNGTLSGEADILQGINLFNDFGADTEMPSTKLYDFRVYDQKLSNEELIELTT